MFGHKAKKYWIQNFAPFWRIWSLNSNSSIQIDFDKLIWVLEKNTYLKTLDWRCSFFLLMSICTKAYRTELLEWWKKLDSAALILGKSLWVLHSSSEQSNVALIPWKRKKLTRVCCILCWVRLLDFPFEEQVLESMKIASWNELCSCKP